MARPEKVAVVDEIREKLTAADASMLTEYRGLTVDEIAELRGVLRPAGAEYKVYKNTLARRAAVDAGREDLLPMFQGPTAIAFVTGDAVLAAKALRDFAARAGIPMLDFPALDNEPGLLVDLQTHLSPIGWLAVDAAIDSVMHGDDY